MKAVSRNSFIFFRMSRNMTFLIASFLVAVACQRQDSSEERIATIPVDIEVVRFEEAFYGNVANDMGELKEKFPYFFPEQFSDSVWTNRREDSLQLVLFEEVHKKFNDFSEQQDRLHKLFQHIKFYFPEDSLPKVVTLMSDVDYQNKVIHADSLLLVSVDTYLGGENPLYDGISRYQREDMYPARLIADATDAMMKSKVVIPASRTFLAKMVYYGKLHYLKDLVIPWETDAVKIGYTDNDIAWVQENEQYMWKYFVENSLLYDTDPKLQRRFIDEAPFSKFFLEFDQETPGSVGQWVGWQIVRSFMANNDVALQTLLTMDAESIFNRSKYKPNR